MSREHGVGDAKLRELPRYSTSQRYSDRERVALEYADRITVTGEDVDDALFARLAELYSPEEVVELTCTVAFENFLSKFHRALRIESQGFCPVSVTV